MPCKCPDVRNQRPRHNHEEALKDLAVGSRQIKLKISGMGRSAHVRDPLHPPSSLAIVVGPLRRDAPHIGVADCGKVCHAARAVVAFEHLMRSIDDRHLHTCWRIVERQAII